MGHTKAKNLLKFQKRGWKLVKNGLKIEKFSKKKRAKMGQQCAKVEKEKINWLKGVKTCNKFPKVAKNGLKIEIFRQQKLWTKKRAKIG